MMISPTREPEISEDIRRNNVRRSPSLISTQTGAAVSVSQIIGARRGFSRTCSDGIAMIFLPPRSLGTLSHDPCANVDP